MTTSLLVLEFIGTPELVLIAFVALIIFGPRKLPELGRTLGKSLGEFKRASEDFKRTWEREVELEKIEREVRIDTEVRDALDSVNNIETTSPPYLLEEDNAAAASYDASSTAYVEPQANEAQTVARTSSSASDSETDQASIETSGEAAPVAATEPTSKKDWL